MKNNKPIFWYQGLFLQPQHFQISDLYNQSLLTPYSKYIQPHFWGVSKFKIDEAALENRSFVIQEGEFLFPDGTYISFMENAVIQPRSFEDAWSDASKPLKVYLGLKKLDQLNENVTLLNSLKDVTSVATRFVSTVDPEEVKDLYYKGPAAQIKHLNYVPKIFWESEKEELSEYVLILVAQLEIEGDNTILSRRFIPPAMKLDASERLFGILKDITDKVVARCRQLDEYKNPGETQAADFDIGNSFFLLALRSLSRYVPLLFNLIDTRNFHPIKAYELLSMLIGELSTFSKNISITEEIQQGKHVVPSYNHLDQWACFSTLQTLIGMLLDEITVGPFSIIRLNFESPHYVGKIDSKILQGNNKCYLVITTGSEQKFVIDAMRSQAKLSALDNMKTLIERALPGVKFVYMQFPPPEMPRRASSLCFEIDMSSTQWEDVKRTGDIALNWDAAPRDLVAEIVVLRRK